MRLAMQCPGCFSVNAIEKPAPDHYLECDECAEKLTIIDLRDGDGDVPLNVDRGSLFFDQPHPTSVDREKLEVPQEAHIWRCPHCEKQISEKAQAEVDGEWNVGHFHDDGYFAGFVPAEKVEVVPVAIYDQALQDYRETVDVDALVKRRIQKRYGQRQYERWALDKRAEVEGFVREEVEQAIRVLGGNPVQDYREKLLGEVGEALTCGKIRDEFAALLGEMVDDKHAAKTYTSQLVWLLADRLRETLAAVEEAEEDPDPHFGKPTGNRCEGCDKEQRVGDEGWESRDMLDWCPDCFREDVLDADRLDLIEAEEGWDLERREEAEDQAHTDKEALVRESLGAGRQNEQCPNCGHILARHTEDGCLDCECARWERPDCGTGKKPVAEVPSGDGGQTRIEALTDHVMRRFRPTEAEWDMVDGHRQAVNWPEVVGQILHYALPDAGLALAAERFGQLEKQAREVGKRITEQAEQASNRTEAERLHAAADIEFGRAVAYNFARGFVADLASTTSQETTDQSQEGGTGEKPVEARGKEEAVE